jgi:hypothetical protein
MLSFQHVTNIKNVEMFTHVVPKKLTRFLITILSLFLLLLLVLF